jgi:hypothetical protein
MMNNSKPDKSKLAVRTKLELTLVWVGLVMTLVSALLVFQGADNEPFFRYDRADAVSQLMAASILVGIWASYGMLVLVLISSRKISPLWFGVVGWALICMLFLCSCPLGYLEDMQQYMLR